MTVVDIYNAVWRLTTGERNVATWSQDSDYGMTIDFAPLVEDRDLTRMNNILADCSAFVVWERNWEQEDYWTVNVQMPFPHFHFHGYDAYSYAGAMEIAGMVHDEYGKDIIVIRKDDR